MEADNSDITDEGAETMKGTGKKAASLILIVLICMMAVMPVQAFGNKKWTIGYEKNTNGPEKKAQGTNAGAVTASFLPPLYFLARTGIIILSSHGRTL